MLDQYILGQINTISEHLKELNSKLQNLQDEEESYNHMIQELLDHQDVGLELFSPRGSDDTTKTKVSRIKQQIEEIRIEEEKIRDEIGEVQKDEKRYQDMLLEIHENDDKPDNSDNFSHRAGEEIEELKKILVRLEKCLNLLNTNKNQCKNEMINLKYYLKALISSK